MFGIHFKEAFEGILKVITTQQTFKVMLLIALITIIAAFYFNFNQTEWLFLLITVSLVLTAEAFNTAIEVFADYINGKRDKSIKLIKDISAAAVMMTVINSIIVGVILFIPKILIFLK